MASPALKARRTRVLYKIGYDAIGRPRVNYWIELANGRETDRFLYGRPAVLSWLRAHGVGKDDAMMALSRSVPWSAR